MTRLAAVDAQFFWRSAKIPSDQFLLYAFAGEPGDLAEILAGLRARAAACDDLRLRIADDRAARYPRWAHGDVDETQFVARTPGLDWTGCLDDVARMADDQVDPTRAAWRLHVFPSVRGAPRTDSTVTVAVLQMAHALADGTSQRGCSAARVRSRRSRPAGEGTSYCAAWPRRGRTGNWSPTPPPGRCPRLLDRGPRC